MIYTKSMGCFWKNYPNSSDNSTVFIRNDFLNLCLWYSFFDSLEQRNQFNMTWHIVCDLEIKYNLVFGCNYINYFIAHLLPFGICEGSPNSVSYTHLRAHETRHDLVCRLLLE